MKDYRLAYRFCVIKGTATIDGDDWRMTEEETAYQSRVKASQSFDQAKKDFAEEASQAGTKSRKDEDLIWYQAESDKGGGRRIHYLRYDEIPLGKNDSEPKYFVLESGTCWLEDNVRKERREIVPDEKGQYEDTAEGSIRNPEHPMVFSRRSETDKYIRIRKILTKAVSTVFFDGLYPDELEQELRKRAVKLESPKKLYNLVKKAFCQGVDSCTFLICSDWLYTEYADWAHSLGWEPGNRHLPEKLANYLNYRFDKEDGLIDENVSFQSYQKKCERIKYAMEGWIEEEDVEMLPDQTVGNIILDDVFIDGFPLLFIADFDLLADVPEEEADKAQRGYDELQVAYVSFKDHFEFHS